MASIKLANKAGELKTYTDVKTIKIPSTTDEPAVFIETSGNKNLSLQGGSINIIDETQKEVTISIPETDISQYKTVSGSTTVSAKMDSSIVDTTTTGNISLDYGDSTTLGKKYYKNNFTVSAPNPNVTATSAQILSGYSAVGKEGGVIKVLNGSVNVNDAKLTIQRNAVELGSFTANASENKTINIQVPTKVGDLTNDIGYTTNKGTVTSVSIKMNGSTKGTVTASGTIDLETVLTAHQDISGKENTFNKVTSWSTTTTDAHYPSEKLVKSALDGKANSSHTHSYAGSSSVGGAATSAIKVANKLTVGSKTFDGSSAVTIKASDLDITYGTSAPSSAANKGAIYFQYTN